MSELRIERTYPVTPERLFAFVTQRQNLLKWWGPEGTSVGEDDLDLSRTGPWSLVLVGPKGRFAMRGTVTAVTPPHAVEFTMNVPGVDADESTVRFEIAPDGTGARLTLIQSGITDEMVEMGKHGWGSTLARLEQLLGETDRAA